MTRIRTLLREMREEYLDILLLGDPRPTVLVLAGFTISLGLIFSLRGEFFHLSPVYSYMQTLGTERGWGAFCITSGVVKLLVCCANRPIMRTRHLAARLAPTLLNVLMFAVWLLLFLGVLVSEPTNPYVAVFGIFSFGTCWTALRRLHSALNVSKTSYPTGLLR